MGWTKPGSLKKTEPAQTTFSGAVKDFIFQDKNLRQNSARQDLHTHLCSTFARNLLVLAKSIRTVHDVFSITLCWRWCTLVFWVVVCRPGHQQIALRLNRFGSTEFRRHFRPSTCLWLSFYRIKSSSLKRITLVFFDGCEWLSVKIIIILFLYCWRQPWKEEQVLRKREKKSLNARLMSW